MDPGPKGAFFSILAVVTLVFGYITLKASGIPIFPSYSTHPTAGNWWQYWLGLIVIVLVLGRMAAVYTREHQLAQKTEGEKNIQTEGVGARYVLYARPFSTEGSIKEGSTPIPLSPRFFSDEHSRTLEELISRALGSVRVLGGAPDILGPLRLQTEADWKEVFKNLASNAELIVILPLGGQGTNWELSWLKDANLLRRTLLIMPRRTFTFDSAPGWENSRSYLAQFGISIPQYDPQGAYLNISCDGTIRSFPLRGYSKRALRDAATQIYYDAHRESPAVVGTS